MCDDLKGNEIQFLLSRGLNQGPTHEFLRVSPDVCGIGFQHNADDGTSINLAGGNQATSGGVRRAGFHAIDETDFFQ